MQVDRSQLVTAKARAASALVADRAAALAQVSTTISTIRRLFITDLPGQEMIYLSKEAEARSCIASPTPDAGDFPFLAREIGVNGTTLDQVAQVVLNVAALWRGIAADLEDARMTANAAIAKAATGAEIAVALAAFETAIKPYMEAQAHA